MNLLPDGVGSSLQNFAALPIKLEQFNVWFALSGFPEKIFNQQKLIHHEITLIL